MMRPLCVLLLASPLVAQLHPVGFRDVGIKNTTGKGSMSLTCRVHYPATTAGRNAPILAKQGGWPVVVFLHGFGGFGWSYPDLGDYMAARGFVMFMSNTAWIQPELQRDDGVAFYKSLVAENARSGSPFLGALDMTQAAVSGHSMGGGNTMRVLSAAVGYKTGVCFAPWDGITPTGLEYFPPKYGPLVKTPILILHGTGDQTLPWRKTGLAWFEHAKSYTGSKTLYLLDNDCDHTNVVRLPRTPRQVDREVLARCLSVAHGWLAHWLAGDVSGLENVLGPSARSEKRLTTLYAGVRQPEHWQTGSGKIGTVRGFRVTAEPGVAALFVAAKRVSIPTPFGILLLDPLTITLFATSAVGNNRLFSWDWRLPNDPGLAGLQLPFQSLATVEALALRLSGAFDLKVTK